MKNCLLVVAIVCFGVKAQASAYFVPNPVFTNPAHPITVQGAMIDPLSLSGSRASVLIPIFTRKSAYEDWTPAAIGGSINAGKVTVDVAPLANVAPYIQTGLLYVVPASWVGVRNILASSGSPVTFSGGPVWEYRQSNNKGYFMVFTGLALAW